MSRYFELVAGDQAPDLEQTLIDGTGAPQDLTGITVKFRMRRFGTEVTVIDAAAAIDAPPTSGKVRYSWAVADKALAPGRYQGRFILTLAGAKPASIPSRGFIDVLISEQIAPLP